MVWGKGECLWQPWPLIIFMILIYSFSFNIEKTRNAIVMFCIHNSKIYEIRNDQVHTVFIKIHGIYIWITFYLFSLYMDFERRQRYQQCVVIPWAYRVPYNTLFIFTQWVHRKEHWYFLKVLFTQLSKVTLCIRKCPFSDKLHTGQSSPGHLPRKIIP